MRLLPFTLVLSLFFLTSCQEQDEKQYDPSVIDRDKLDIALGAAVSNVLFDHLYVVVDSTTYASLTRDSQWKNTYGSLDGGLPNFDPITRNSSSCYLRGHQHSIEILGPNNTYNEPVGKSGIGFSLKNKGEHFHLGIVPKLRVEKDSLLYATEMVKMPLSGEDHTWFKAFYTPSRGTALHTWYAFYDPNFLNQLKEEEHTEYSREAFLASSYADDKLFHSIGEIRLSCTQNDFRRIAQELGGLKSELLDQQGSRYTIRSGDITIVIEPTTDVDYSRITQITCNLNEKDESVSTLGNVTITNKGTLSVWDFNGLHEGRN